MKILLISLYLLMFTAAAPFVSGVITKIKNFMRLRTGPGIFQPYYNLVKLFSKGEVVSDTASWIFRVAPYVVLSATLTAASLISVFVFSNPLRHSGDLLALIFIFALGRFFMALAALDTGSSFGGMGASREMFISSLAEPVLCLVLFSVSLPYGSTSLSAFSAAHPLTVSSCAAAVALFLVTIAETSRVPVDNQETHLELTMVHEAMLLEYSGKPLALFEIAAYVKQLTLFVLIAQILFPLSAPVGVTLSQLAVWIMWYCLRILIIAVSVALVEVSVAKMRLFRVADFLGFAFVLGVIATVCAVLGV